MPKNQELRKETIRFRESPLGFRLSAIKVEARKKNPGKKPIAHPCSFCGSVKLLGDANARAFSKSGRAFCDEECASEWKSIHYASANHKPFEESRQRTREKRAIEAEAARKRAEEREIARLLKPANQKTSGYYTCEVCKKTEWVASHSMKRFCSDKCRGKSIKAIATKKRAKRNRRHRIRAGSTIREVVCLYKLMQKHRNRCGQCNTLCVKPEGSNHSNEGTIDHIMPLSKGGLHLWNNVQLLCRQCNSAKRDIVLPGTQMMLRLEE
jgi:5-methylcytosine-specific restriction endonuclease McrA